MTTRVEVTKTDRTVNVSLDRQPSESLVVGTAPIQGPRGPVGPQGPSGPQFATFTVPGVLYSYEGQSRFYFYRAASIQGVFASLGTIAVEPVEIDVKLNGSTLFDSPLTITAGEHLGSLPLSLEVQEHDYLTVSILSVAQQGDPGANLTVQVEYSYLADSE